MKTIIISILMLAAPILIIQNAFICLDICNKYECLDICNKCNIEILVNSAPIDIDNFIACYRDCSDMSVTMIDWFHIHGYKNYTYLVIGACPIDPIKHAWVEVILNNETIYIETTSKRIINDTNRWKFHSGAKILDSEQFWRFNSSMDAHLNFCSREFNLTRNSLKH